MHSVSYMCYIVWRVLLHCAVLSCSSDKVGTELSCEMCNVGIMSFVCFGFDFECVYCLFKCNCLFRQSRCG